MQQRRSAQVSRRAAALAATAALTAGGSLAVSAPSFAGTRGSHASAVKAHTITVIEHAITDTEAPLAPGGKDENGDILTFNNPVFNPANKLQVGHDEGFCTRIQVKLGIWECLWTTFLKGGQLTVQGPYYDKRNSVLTITGGTGAYVGASGEMNLNAKDGGKEYDFIFHIS